MTEKEKALIEAKANILKALGHPTRLWMAEQLAGGEKCVCELAENIDADFSTVSKHLTDPQAGRRGRGRQARQTGLLPAESPLHPQLHAVRRGGDPGPGPDRDRSRGMILKAYIQG